MLKRTCSLIVLSIVATLASTPASAQTTSGTGMAAQSTVFVTSQAANEARATKLVGILVRNAAGEVIGDINDLVVQEGGRVIAVIIGVGGFLGVGEKNVGVPFEAMKLLKDASGTRSATLDITKTQLQAAPAFVGEKTTFETVQDGAIDIAKSAQKSAKDMMKTP